MLFSYDYTVQFRDTDAARVVYFATILSICHVAYEASLVAAEIELKSFVSNPEFAIPIAHVSADILNAIAVDWDWGFIAQSHRQIMMRWKIQIECGNLHYYLAILQSPIVAWKKLSYHHPSNYSTSPT